MKTSYKFAFIKRQDNIHISECGVRFYEGEVTTKDEKDFLTGKLIPITRYRISGRLQKEDLTHLKSNVTIKDRDPITQELNNLDVIIYTSKDFGIISSNDELRVFLNSELMKDKNRTPEETQNTLDITKVK